MDSAPRRSYSALPWEKRRERPLACVALPRREPVRRVVHLERAPADGRTVAARGGQLLRRVAHGRARAPSPGLAVRYDARVRPGGRAACLAGARLAPRARTVPDPASRGRARARRRL